MIYAGYVKVARGKPQIGRVKLKISSGRQNFLRVKEKIHHEGGAVSKQAVDSKINTRDSQTGSTLFLKTKTALISHHLVSEEKR